MSPVQLATVFVRLFALLVGSAAFRALAVLRFGEDEGVNLAMLWSLPVMLGAVATVAWFFPARVARVFVGPAPDFKLEVSAAALATVGCCLLGLYTLIQALPQAVKMLLILSSPALAEFVPTRYVDVMEVGLHVAFGAGLTLKARTVAVYLCGSPRADEDDSPAP